jgi:hypothetical protein
VKPGNRFQSSSSNRFDSDFLSFGVGSGGTVKAHVVDEGNGLVPYFGGTIHQFFWRGGPAEKGKI